MRSYTPDADLGERVVAWVVPADTAAPPAPEELAAHVAGRLAPHKRPRTVRYLGGAAPQRHGQDHEAGAEGVQGPPVSERLTAREAVALVTDDFTERFTALPSGLGAVRGVDGAPRR